jgi:hypothetical protein
MSLELTSFDLRLIKVPVFLDTRLVNNLRLTEARMLVNQQTRSTLHALECVIGVAIFYQPPVPNELDDGRLAGRCFVEFVERPGCSCF